MKAFSLFLLLSGWFVVVSAIALLRPAFIPVFAVAGLAVVMLGLVMLARAHASSERRGLIAQQERRS